MPPLTKNQSSPQHSSSGASSNNKLKKIGQENLSLQMQPSLTKQRISADNANKTQSPIEQKSSLKKRESHEPPVAMVTMASNKKRSI